MRTPQLWQCVLGKLFRLAIHLPAQNFRTWFEVFRVVCACASSWLWMAAINHLFMFLLRGDLQSLVWLENSEICEVRYLWRKFISKKNGGISWECSWFLDFYVGVRDFQNLLLRCPIQMSSPQCSQFLKLLKNLKMIEKSTKLVFSILHIFFFLFIFFSDL